METDEVAYVLVAGFDKGEKDNLVVTASIAKPRTIAGVSGGGGGGGGGEGGGASTVVLSVETYAPAPMVNLFNTVIARQISLSHTRAFVFSEELAREGIGKWFLPFARYREVRGNTQIFVCRGKAKDFIEKNKPSLEINPTKQFEFIANLSRRNGLYPSIQFENFYSEIKARAIEASAPLVAVHEGGLESARPGVSKGGDIALGKYIAGEVPISGGNKVQAIGTAVFHGDKMAGYLNGQETRYYLMLRGRFDQGFTSIPDPFAGEPVQENAYIGFQIHQERKPKYTTHIDEDGNVSIDVEIFLEPEIIASTSSVSFESPDLKTVLEETFSKYIEQGCNTLVKRTQEEFKSDIFGFGYQVKHNFWTIPPWEEFKWLERYPDAQVNVTVHTRIRRTGLLLKTLPFNMGGEGG
jgi:spore germination protein KC